jgi:hypothetical protein
MRVAAFMSSLFLACSLHAARANDALVHLNTGDLRGVLLEDGTAESRSLRHRPIRTAGEHPVR